MHVFLLSCLAMIVACSTTIAAETRPVTRPADDPTEPKAVADRLGCTHAAGTYSFTKGDFLNEGADRILSLGMRVIKAYLRDPQKMYPHNSQWPKFDNLVDIAMKGRRTVTNNVVPHARCDLYSYSAYDTIAAASADVDQGRILFRSALNYLASKAPDSPTFGAKNVYVGEFGWPCVPSEQDRDASEEKSLRVIRMTLEESLSWGCPYVIYWQVYDNESRAGKERPTNDQVRGFYLIRPDGTYAPAWDYFASVLRREGHATGSGPAATPADKNGR